MVITVPEKGPAINVVRNVRKLNPSVPIIARAHRATDRDEQLQQGATHMVQPEIEASATLVSKALRCLNLSQVNAEAYSEVLRAGLDNYAGVSAANTNFPALQEVKVGHFPGDGETLGEAHVRRKIWRNRRCHAH